MKPKQLTSDQIQNLRYIEGQVPAGIWGKIYNGRMCPASDGTRLALIVSGDQIIFTLLEKKPMVFVQDTTSFIEDLNAYPMEEAGKRALPMARFTQAAVEFILGVAACALGPLGAVAVTTVDIYKFCAENRLMIIAAGKAWYHVARVRGVLMVHTPTLHALLEATVWRSSWEALKSVPGLLINSSTAMPASIADEAAGRLAGTIVGKLSIADFKSKLGILKVVLQLLLAIILKAAPVAGKAVAAKLSQADAAVIKDLIDAARRIGVSVSQNEGPKIVAELKRHGAMIKPLLETAVQSIKAVEEAAKTAEGTSAAGGAQK